MVLLLFGGLALLIILFIVIFSRHSSTDEKRILQKQPANEHSNILNVEPARHIYLDFPRNITQDETENINRDQDWNYYWQVYNKAYFYYQYLKSYIKAKKEWLRIYEWQHTSDSYNEFLADCYRQLAAKFIARKQYYKALLEMQDMFQKCSEKKVEDINLYNDLIEKMSIHNPAIKLHKIPLGEDINFEFQVNPILVELLKFVPRKDTEELPDKLTNFYQQYYNLCFNTLSFLPNIEFSYQDQNYSAENNQKCFDLTLKTAMNSYSGAGLAILTQNYQFLLFDDHLRDIFCRDLAQVLETYKDIKCINFSNEQNLALFTVKDTIYLLDRALKVTHHWKMSPSNECKDSIPALTDPEIKEKFQNILHPVLFQADMDIDSKIKKIIETIRNYCIIFKKSKDFFLDILLEKKDKEEAWQSYLREIILDKNKPAFYEENEILATHIHDIHEKIFIATFSGKIYQITGEGKAEKIWHLPYSSRDIANISQVIKHIRVFNSFLHILLDKEIYIVNDEKTIKTIALEGRTAKWFDQGFILIGETSDSLEIYEVNGELFETIKFKYKVKFLAAKKNYLIVETMNCNYFFKLKMKTK
ncbi:MAG: hypothetical protein PHV30_06270 [Candidatus Margulisbacteria bacterium]|nr:hypothetical protein [Candidatus Margulisiibacteriota bacterium]